MPEIPAVPRAAELSAAVNAAFAADGPLARVLPGFEARPGQLDMSHDFEAAVEEGSTMVRVGTAIFGKRQARV